MRLGRLLLLALVVLGLGAYILLVERHQPTTAERAERKDKLFPTFDQAKAARLAITNSHGSFELVREKDAWKLVAPLADEANESAVTSLLSSLAGLKAERTLPAKEVKLADYGLDKPAITLTVTAKDGAKDTLKLGAEMPLGNERAAETSGDDVYLVNKYIASDLDKDLSGWRSTQLAQVYATDVASLTIKGAASRVALAHAAGLWTITDPIADLADQDRAEGLVGDLNGGQIKEFVDHPGDLKALGLEPPQLEITVVRKDNKPPLQLAFGNTREEKKVTQRLCKRGERVFWVDDKLIKRASPAVADWRSKKLVHLQTWAADTLLLESGKEKADLARESGVWKAGKVEVDGDAVSRRLGVLADMQVTSFDQPKPSAPAIGHVKVTVEEGAPVEATFYRGSSADKAFAEVPGRAGVLGVDSAKVLELLEHPAELAKPKPTPTPAVTPSAAAKPTAPAAKR
jgi:Domain of unknown function (DUF4340)